MIKSNCHTHTLYCDGKNTAEEMIEAAIDENFESIGFSVHSPLTYENDYSAKQEDMSKYLNEIRQLKEKYKNKIEVYCGIELDADHAEFNRSDYDFIIASVHQIHGKNRVYPIDYTPEILSECVEEEFGGDWIAMAKSYYSDLSKFVCDVKPDVVGHFDLINKFNENKQLFDYSCPEYKLIVQMYLERICYCCPDSIFEVNTGAMFRCGNKKPYPTKYVLKFLHGHNMKITITSDSHCTQSLSYGFAEAAEYCKSCGYTDVYLLKGGKFVPSKI